MNDRRRSGSAAPRAATPAVVVAVTLIAAILGFLILRQFRVDETATSKTPAAGDVDAEGAGTTVPGAALDPGATLAPTVAPTPSVAAVAIPRTEFNVLVANASKLKGTAKALTEAMQKAGFKTNPPTNAVIADVLPAMPIPVTRVMYSPTFETAAADVANFLGLTVTEVMPSAGPPIEAGAGIANVVVLLGTDLANQVPPGAGGPAPTTAPTAVAGAVTTTTVA